MEIPQRRFLGHPDALAILFFTELWERFSFYGMRALLIFYLTRHFQFTDDEAYGIYGSYTALVYIGPLLGGLVADRLIGARRAVALGAVLLALGHFAMAIEAPPALVTVTAEGTRIVTRSAGAVNLLFLALALIIVGSAFLKPNISALVGRLYAPGDPQRDAGFTLFYMGINIGAAAATLLCGYLGEHYGWRYGFGLAGFGMLIGLAVFVIGRRKLLGLGDAPDPPRLAARAIGPLTQVHMVYLGAGLAILLAARLLHVPDLVGSALAAACALVAAGLVGFALLRCAPAARDRLLVALGLMIAAVIFFALFEQAGSSLNLFADRNVTRTVLGVTIPAAQLQSLNPLFIILLAPLFGALWTSLAHRQRGPSTPLKFALGLIQAGLGFGMLVLGAEIAQEDGRIPFYFLVVAYLLHTTGELCLSPIGLSAMTKLSPLPMVGFVMGAWFLATAAAQYLASLLARLASASVPTEGADPLLTLPLYIDLFTILAGLGIGAGLVLVLLAPVLKRGMHGAD